MKKQEVSLNDILISLILICIVIIGFQYLKIKQLEKNVISLATGTPLPDMELTPINNSYVMLQWK